MKCRNCGSEIAKENYWMRRHLWDLHSQLKNMLYDVDLTLEHLDEQMKAAKEGFCSPECLAILGAQAKAKAEG